MPKKKYQSKKELEAEFQKLVEKKWEGKKISQATYKHYSDPRRHEMREYRKLLQGETARKKPRKRKVGRA